MPLTQHAAVQAESVVDDSIEIGRYHARSTQARELRELIDETFQGFDLGNDGVCTLAN
jgi:hypothetical protein